MIGLFIGLFIGAFFGFVTCGFMVANDEPKQRQRGLDDTTGDEWNVETEDIDD